jgi:hypothetical protein
MFDRIGDVAHANSPSVTRTATLRCDVGDAGAGTRRSEGESGAGLDETSASCDKMSEENEGKEEGKCGATRTRPPSRAPRLCCAATLGTRARGRGGARGNQGWS